MRHVRCTTSDCENRGIVRNVADQRVATGVVCRPTLFCAACGAQMQEGDAKPAATAGVKEKAVRRPTEKRG